MANGLSLDLSSMAVELSLIVLDPIVFDAVVF